MCRSRRSLSSGEANRPPAPPWATVPAGFTLVELMAVLVILGLAAAIVVPMVSNTGDIEASAAARKLTSDLLFAQNHAITHQTRVRLSFDCDANQYTLAEVPASGDPVVLTHPVTRRPFVVGFNAVEGLEKVDLASADFSSLPQVEFDSLGAPSQGGTVILTSGTFSRGVSVAPVTGKVTVD